MILPALGESITEGIITKWFKAVGETVERDEPLFEISTDKVDSEVPSPASGVLIEIRAEEGDTVLVGATLAVIGDSAEGIAPPATPAPAAPAPGQAPAPVAAPAPAAAAPAAQATTSGTTNSPMVRRILDDAGVSAGSVDATGPGGRITRADAERAAAARATTAPLSGRAPVSLLETSGTGTATQGFVAIEASYESVELARRSPAARAAQGEGIVLDDVVFAIRAAVEALAEFPALNASVGPAGAVAHSSRNIGVAIDVADGLLVPVVSGAQDLNLRGLSRRLAEVLDRARAGQLGVEDLVDGTFTVAPAASPEVYLSVPPLIESQVAVLSVDGVSRQAVVLTGEDGTDSIAVRSVGILGLGFDRRVIDGTTATRFLSRVAELLATQDWTAEL